MKRENTKQVHLMMWETNPNLRNYNNEIKFYLSDGETPNEGDKIYTKTGDKYSVFTITEITEIRKGSVSGMNYVTAKSSWGFEKAI